MRPADIGPMRMPMSWRTRSNNIPQHEDTYNRNAQAWHYTNARINELIQEVEQILEAQDRQVLEELRFKPPKDSLIPPGHSTGTPSPIRSVQGREQESRDPSETISTRGGGGQDGRTAFKSPYSPNKESQKEERDSVIDAVKQITGAQTEIPGQGRTSTGDTPEYYWDTGYDGIRGFSSRLKNRVSETSTPQGGQSPRGRPRTPQPQRLYKRRFMMRHLLVGLCLLYNKSDRQIYGKSSRKREWTHLAIFVAILAMIIETVLKRPIVSHKMLGRALLWEEILGAAAQIVTFLIQAYVLVHGVINGVT